ncbi:protein-export chaperone SecB [Methylocystis sp. 9N]|uniref:Protein-export protein SecB n=1 Tax=Methylocystis borbori TaxID=3118750 RepID=A0ABU7XIW5_9HYPH
MTDTNGNGAQETPGGAPALNALAQYLKDFSFENPNAPRSLGPQEQAPNIGIQVNVNAKQLAATDFEVTLTLDAKAGEGEGLLFQLDLEYGGVFRLLNIPQEQVHPIVMIECPRLLFPFVRQIVAEATRQGGYPPLYIDPIDFVALYQQKAAEAAGQASAQPN